MLISKAAKRVKGNYTKNGSDNFYKLLKTLKNLQISDLDGSRN